MKSIKAYAVYVAILSLTWMVLTLLGFDTDLRHFLFLVAAPIICLCIGSILILTYVIYEIAKNKK